MGKQSAEDKVRKRLNDINDKLHDDNNALKLKKIIIIAAICLCALALMIFLMMIDKVKEIKVKGELTAYNETRVIEASGIDIGESIFKRTSFGIKRNIRKSIPMTEKVKIRRNIFTGKITIDIEFDDFDYFVKYGKNYYAVDENLVVMDKRGTKSEYFSLGARYIEIPDILEPQIGKELIFEDTVPEDEDDTDVVDIKEYKYIYDILKVASDSKHYGEMNVLSLKEKFNINAIYDRKYRVYIGNPNQLDTKFKMLDGVLDEGSLEYAEKGIIDITDPSKVSARAVTDSYGTQEGSDMISPVDFSKYFS